MSKLGSLFGGGGGGDNNDQLKYSAPKEPKKSAPVKTAPVATTPVIDTSRTYAAAAPSKPLGPSKIMASATVRLFKVNPSTHAYDSVDGGNQLGCVIMGTGTTFQILIYNGQKAAQATIMLTATTDYTVRDLYMSLTDTQGTSWSILFDSPEVMHTCLRTIVAVIVHQATHSETPIAWETLQRSLPANPENASGDEQQQLAVGMAAGIYLSVWELGDVSDYPGDIVAGRALRQVVAPEEVIKIKLAAGVEEVVAGLTTALVGLKKGDRFMLGVSPKMAYKITEGGFINVAARQFPGSWLLVEAEVVKIKSSEGKDKKKEKAAAAAAAAVSSPVKNDVPNDIDYSDNSNNGSNSDLKDRMKRLSGGAGMNMMAAAAASERASHHNNNSNNQDAQNDRNNNNNYNNNSGSSNNNNNGYNGSNNNNNNNSNNNQSNRDNGRDYDSRSNNNNNNNRDNDYRDNRDNNNNYGRNNNSNNDGYGGRGGGRDNNYNDNNRGGGGNYNNNNNNSGNNYRDNNNRDNRGDNRFNDRNDNRGYNNNNEYALTVVDGQEARSYYMDEDHSGNSLHNRGANERANRPGASAADTSSLQSSMMVIQQSIMQLHTKLDAVGTQVSTSVTLQQQHAGHAVGPYGAPPAGAMNPYGMPPAAPQMGYMGMPGAPYQQMQMYQQHAAPSSVKLRGDELISSLQFIISEYENSSKNAANSSKNSEHLETIAALKANIAKLEEKNETLLTRNEKLMTEKSALLEKQADMIQSGSNSSNKLYSLQQEVETLRREKQNQQSELDSLRNRSSAVNQQQQESDRAEKMELRDKVSSLQNEVVDLKMKNSDLESVKYQLNDKEARLRKANDEIDSLQSRLEQALNSAAAASSRSASVDLNSPEVQNLLADRVGDVQKKLNQTNDELTEAKAALSDEQKNVRDLKAEVSEWKDKFTALQNEWVNSGSADKDKADGLQTRVNELLTQVEELKEQVANGGGSGGKASGEELKAIMQDIYVKASEYFPTEDGDEDTSYSAKDVLKRVRMALKQVTSARAE